MENRAIVFVSSYSTFSKNLALAFPDLWSKKSVRVVIVDEFHHPVRELLEVSGITHFPTVRDAGVDYMGEAAFEWAANAAGVEFEQVECAKGGNTISDALRSPTFEQVTLVVGVIGTVTPFLQAHRIWAVQSAHAVSLPGYFIALTASLVWLAYGWARGILPIVVCNAITVVGILLVVCACWCCHKGGQSDKDKDAVREGLL